MAQIYPKQPKMKTMGEEKVLKYLQNNLNDSWHVYYEPIIESYKPDFVLYSPYCGVLVLEVKDYTQKTIHSLAPDYWSIYTENNIKSITAPIKQVEEYSYKLIALFERQNMLLNTDGAFQGRLKFPVMQACWFINMSKENIKELHIDQVIPENLIFSKETLELEIEFELRAQQIIKSKFAIEPLSHQESELIRKMLYPEYILPGIEEQRIQWFRKFKQNILIFPNIIDEILFIATEIRHLQLRVKSLSNISVIYDEERFYKNKFIREQILDIFSAMGVPVANNNGQTMGVSITALEHTALPSKDSVLFVLDLKQSSLDEKKEAFLSKLLKDASINTYFTSSDLS